MATNVEIKAKVRDPDRLRKRIEELSETPCEVIRQEDTFFQTPSGRLKLRVLAPDRGQLIYYDREDASGPSASNYVIYETSDPNSLVAVLSAGLGIRGVVRKERMLCKVGNTRIHLDEVEKLGVFVELEVVLGPIQDLKKGEGIALEMMKQLGIERNDLVGLGYIDLLEGRTA